MQSAQIFFTKMPSGAATKLHPADKKQLFSILAGQIEITVGDGEKRVFGQGDVLLIEDIAGKGHQGRIVGDQDFVAATVNMV
jgi:quercetin dioxygenase-like cupin family protein